MRVLIIAEDFTYDQFILKPIVQAMMRHLGRPQARVAVCYEPVLGGIVQATNWEQIQSIIQQYQMIDLFLLCIDRDGQVGRRERLNNLEQQAETLFPKKKFLAENAWQEIEVWALAGQNLPSDWNWQTIRAELDPKELYFRPYARQRGLGEEPGIIYEMLGKEAAKRYGRIRTRCPEVLELETRIQSWNPA